MPGRNTAFLTQERFDEIRNNYSRFNEPWLEDEVEELKQLAAEGVSKDVMAIQLQRTPNSVQLKLKSLGLFIPRQMPPRWTEFEDKALVEMYNEGESFEEMATCLGRSVNGIIGRLIHLRVKIFNKDGR